MSALGQKQPVSIISGERLVLSAYRPFRLSLDQKLVLNVCFRLQSLAVSQHHISRMAAFERLPDIQKYATTKNYNV